MSGAGATGLLGWFADWLPLALAGGAGAACRWSVDTHVNRLSGRTSAAASASALERRRSGASPWMPWGTVVVNVTACLLMGLLVGRAADPPHSGAWAATALTVVGTGFLGGYSTFSTACVEGARLLLAGRWGPALAHATLMTAAPASLRPKLHKRRGSGSIMKIRSKCVGRGWATAPPGPMIFGDLRERAVSGS